MGGTNVTPWQAAINTAMMAMMGAAVASGENRAVEAAQKAVSSPLLEASIEGARGILMTISGPSDVGLFEVNEGALRRQGWSSEALRQTLDEAGYALWEIDDASGDLRPLAADLQAGSQDVVAMHREGP